MKRAFIFGKRCLTEMVRDPLSYIFCLGFPIIMLIVMTVVDKSIPEETGMTLFHIGSLTGGITIFGQMFVMLFTALNVAHDRSGSFLARMYATPMKPLDFVAGYVIPSLVIAVAQAVVTFASALVIALITGGELSVTGMLISLLPLMPSALMFIGLGLIAGTLFSEKAAPGLCSVVISVGSMLGCIWFDAQATGGVMLTVCKAMPFFYCTKSVRAAISNDLTFDSFILPLIVVAVCAIVIICLSAIAFSSKMRADLE